MFSMNQAYNAYYLGDRPFPALEHSMAAGEYVLSYSDKTEIQVWKDAGRQVVVMGICVDSHGEIPRDAVARYLGGQQDAVDKIAEKLARFAGAFLVFVFMPGEAHILPDATVSVPAYFLEDGKGISSHEKILAEYNGLDLDPIALRLKQSGSVDATLSGQ